MYTTYRIPRPEQELAELERFIPPDRDCSHYFILTRQDCAGGSIQYKQQCTMCGTAGPAISHAKLTDEEKDSAHEYDPYLATRIDNKARELWRLDHPFSAYHISDTTWYKGYMQSDEWQEKSRLVIEREHDICQACRIAWATQAHHLNYDHVGNEPLFDLVAVCKPCHEKIHGRKF